jgi:CTP-dependent riboflavin kinase
MRVLEGRVEKGKGVASGYLRHVLHLIGERIGLPNPAVDGTLNIRIAEPYIVPADATVLPAEYNNVETLKLKRCRVNGIRCCIMRPNLHETVPESEAEARRIALTRLEIMSDHRLRTTLNLNDGDPVEVEIDGDQSWWNAPNQQSCRRGETVH